ncbi:MAG: DNA translocase FtsK 4TM domain-containing protein, partial [Alloacidobacterium sp.]
MKPLKLVLTPTRNRRLNELIGLMVLVVAGLLLLALASYHPTDPSFNTVVGATAARPENWVGVVGAYISDLLLQLEGAAASCLPLLLAVLGWTWMRSLAAGSPWAKALGALLALIFVPAIFGLMPGHLHFLGGLPMEGLTGRLVVDALVQYLNFPGACIFTIAMVAVAVYLSTTFSFNTAKEWLAIRFAFVLAWRDRWTNWRQARVRAREAKKRARAEAIHEKELVKAAKAEAKQEKLNFRKKPEAAAEEDTVPAHRQSGFAEMLSEPEPLQKSVWEQMPRATVPDPEPEPEPPPSIAVNERADAEIHKVTLTPKAHNGFRLPPSTLLHRSEDTQVVREDELRTEAQVLVEKCAEFDVTGQVVQINPGPVVTTFEFRPEAGVKYSRVTGLAEDLCLAMRAESILIERMAGKSTVGIQVPNHERETIWLRDVIEAENFGHSKSKLTLAMGKDINGRIVTADLAAMPHVLIAGSTGSGKSVAINAMIMSVLFKATPEQVRMILVDPKRVELGMYEGIPHLFTPIITEPKLAANALRNAVREMERRLKLLASRSVRNIDQYNKLFENGTPSLFDEEEEQKPLPYIVIIID